MLRRFKFVFVRNSIWYTLVVLLLPLFGFAACQQGIGDLPSSSPTNAEFVVPDKAEAHQGNLETADPQSTPTPTVALTSLPQTTVTVEAAATAAADAFQAFALKSSIWNQASIPVCWDTQGYTKEKDWVRKAIARTWMRESQLVFRGWQGCVLASKGIRITIDDVGPHVKVLGHYLDGKMGGMVLNFTFNTWSSEYCKSPKQIRQYCIEAIAVHEFGHAIGFAHEQNRPDAPAWCKEQAQGGNGDFLVTEFDMDSIMNYCNTDWNNAGLLSQLDITAVRSLYGHPLRIDIDVSALELSARILVAGNIDGDGRDEIAIGIDAEKSGGNDFWVMEFEPGRNEWRHVSPGNHPLDADFDASGKDVGAKFAVTGDFDGDGRDEIAIGIDAEKSGGNDFWVMEFEPGRSEWRHVSPGNHMLDADFDASGKDVGAKFAVTGDFDGDGRDEIAIGIDAEKSGGNDFWVMEFEPESNEWRHVSPGNHPLDADFDASAQDVGAKFAVTGDFDGDGRDEIAIGIDAEKSGGNDFWVMEFEPEGRTWLHLVISGFLSRTLD